MTSDMEISVLFIHIESLTISSFSLEVNGLCKRSIQILLKDLGDSFNERLAVICQLLTFALMGQTSIELLSAEIGLVVLQTINQEQ